MLLCGWSPPAGASASGGHRHQVGAGAMTPVALPRLTEPSARAGAVAFGRSPCQHRSACECDGISDSSSVTVSDAAGLAQIVQRQARALPGMHRRAALQIGQREVAILPSPP